MVNAFSEITSYEGDYNDIADKYLFIGIFLPILKKYNDKPQTAKAIIKYIAYCFSIESTKITISGDRRRETGDVFRELAIDKELYKSVVLLEDESILDCVHNWLKFQDSRQIEYLFTLQQQYVQQQAASLSKILKSTGEVDWDQKMKCIEHMKSLKDMIKDAESELYQNNPKLKNAYKDVDVSKKSNTMGAEAFVSKK